MSKLPSCADSSAKGRRGQSRLWALGALNQVCFLWSKVNLRRTCAASGVAVRGCKASLGWSGRRRRSPVGFRRRRVGRQRHERIGRRFWRGRTGGGVRRRPGGRGCGRARTGGSDGGCARIGRRRCARNSKCDRVFDHRDHKERREATNLRLICHFFVFSVLSVVEYVLHLELLPGRRGALFGCPCYNSAASAQRVMHGAACDATHDATHDWSR